MRAKELRSILAGKGCVELRQKGSHLIIRCGKCQTTVPVHNEDIGTGLLKAIEKQLTPCLGAGWLGGKK